MFNKVISLCVLFCMILSLLVSIFGYIICGVFTIEKCLAREPLNAVLFVFCASICLGFGIIIGALIVAFFKSHPFKG